VNQISVRSGDHAVSGTLVTIGTRLETRIVGVDGHSVEIPPAASMLVVHNDDRPGMIGMVGVALGEAGVSISSMAVGPDQRTKTALMVLSTETPDADRRHRPTSRHRRHPRHPLDHAALSEDSVRCS
jgi:D-3-phosphoglycerate dehydrogenase